MKVAVVKERCANERRVALVPGALAPLQKAGCQILVESGAGLAAGYPDEAYVEKKAEIVDAATAMQADVVLGVRWAGASPADLSGEFRPGQVIVGTCDPLGDPQAIERLAQSGVRLFGLELIPRITRAQSMDVLSSMATVAGYRAVLLAALELPQDVPADDDRRRDTLAGESLCYRRGCRRSAGDCHQPALGAVVHAYDVRPAVREQCESLGAKFVELPLETAGAEGQGGYAQAMDEDFYRRQRELMARVVAESDVVITTAAIPGKRSPLLITADAVAGMQPGSVIVDLAAERGGNCELSQPEQRLESHGVTILGPTNLPSDVPRHASQMYAKNIATFLNHLIKDGQVQVDLSDEITRDTLLTQDGQVVHPRLRDLLNLEPLPAASADTTDASPSS